MALERKNEEVFFTTTTATMVVNSNGVGRLGDKIQVVGTIRNEIRKQNCNKKKQGREKRKFQTLVSVPPRFQMQTKKSVCEEFCCFLA